MAAHGDLASASRRSTSRRCSAWKESVVGKLTGGLAGLAKQRKVEVVHGDGAVHRPERGRRRRPHDHVRQLHHRGRVRGRDAARCCPTIPRVIDSTGALSPGEIPERLLVIGGGIIGLEMATVYDALGARVTVVELLDQLIPGCDADLVRPLHKRISERYEAVHARDQVTVGEAAEERAEGRRSPTASRSVFDRILVAVGRKPERRARSAPTPPGSTVDERGLHPRRPPDADQRPVDLRDRRHRRRPDARPQGLPRGQDRRRGDRRCARRRVRRPHDPVGRLHRSRGRVDGPDRDRRAREQGIEFEKAVFPWAASGRALSLGARRRA